MTTATSPPARGLEILGFQVNRVIPFCVAVGFLFLAVRQLHFVARYSVDMMFGDQWDFYGPLFRQEGWWQTFSYQHGPHRQGIGMVVTRILAGITGWNSRGDSIAISSALIGAAGLGIWLARRFGVPGNSLALLAVPLIFLNVHQFEIFVGPSNLSHGGMPILLLMCWCLAQFIPHDRSRLTVMTGLNFLLVFTGFGIFMGLVTPIWLLLEMFQSWRRSDRSRVHYCALMLLAVGATWALFSWGYTFQPAAPHFRFPYEHPAEYLVFIARMFGNFFGVGELSSLQLGVGTVAVLLVAVIGIGNGLRCLRSEGPLVPENVVLCSLAMYVLIYCVNTAIGRVFLGPYAPLATRYVTLLIPGFLAIFLQIALIRSVHWRVGANCVFVGLLIPATAFLRADEIGGINWFSDGRRSWKRVYLRTHSVEQANQEAHFSIYPGSIKDRLKYLEDHQLNLFVP